MYDACKILGGSIVISFTLTNFQSSGFFFEGLLIGIGLLSCGA